MTDYLSLFSEPEGPEGLRLYIAEKQSQIKGKDIDHSQEMALAGDAFDEVLARSKNDQSPYLSCLHQRYTKRLPSLSSKPTVSVDSSTQLTTFTLSAKETWQFIFSTDEERPDTIIAPDGISLGDMNEDPCIKSK